jgi:hypothetical protein
MKEQRWPPSTMVATKLLAMLNEDGNKENEQLLSMMAATVKFGRG